jgi:NACHT domain
VDVRLEAPADVDDIVVRYADGHREWIQAKTRVERSGQAWNGMWTALADQLARPEFGGEDRLVLVLGEVDETARAIRDLAERAATTPDASEWAGRLGDLHMKVLSAVERALAGRVDALELFRRTTVEVVPLEEVERAFERRRLGTAFALPSRFLSVLRDIAGGGARRRAMFLAAALRTRLAIEFGVEVAEPAEWGLPAYRSTIERLSRIEIPGTGISGSSEDLFVWPRARDLNRAAPADFEDEAPTWDSSVERSNVDLRRFPSQQVDRYIIVAGPGYGKSTLLNAVAARLTRTPYVPVFVPLATFAASDGSVLEFLADEINRELDLRVDWARLAELGSAVLLFDGLDEIPSSRRRAVLDRIATFSARHPLVPWLLTVRDPAVFSGPADGRLIELLPLDNSDIVRFADTLKSRVPGLDSWEFARRLEAYPDMARLARIPLFLTMLLALTGPAMTMPGGRADLIESYLKTLFSPHEHKALQSPPPDTSALRRVAEALAYGRLEAQEIGTTEREVLETAARVGVQGEAPDAVLARMLAQGVLRRQSAIRLQFPYPIVQEYLAACHLVRAQPETLSRRIDDAIQRPWAQVIQFALELHEQPSPIVREMLMRSDDAFSTGLRLVARCIVNGARVDAALRDDVARRLTTVWAGSSWRIRERVGRLIVDGFSQPLLPEVRAVLGNRWLEHSGGGEIVTRADDPSLTREVLCAMLDRGLDRFVYLHSLQPAIDRLGNEALGMYASKARDPDVSEDQRAGLANLVGALSPARITAEPALDLACDEALPDELRLEAFSVAGNSLDQRAWPVIDRALHSTHYGDRWAALKAISRSPDPGGTILKLLRDESLDLERREEIAGRIADVLKNKEGRLSFIRDRARDPNLSVSLRGIMLAFSARYGDEQAFRLLIGDLTTADLRLAGATISLFGHYPYRDLGTSAAAAVQDRVCDSREAAAFASHAATGMTYIFEMDGFDSGLLQPAPPHPALDAWADLVETWMDRNDATEIQRITIAVAALRLGSLRAIDRVESLVHAIGDPDDVRFDQEDEHGHTIRAAVDELQRRRRLLPLPLAERFVRANRPNVPYAGVNAIAARGDRSALDLLITLHNEPPKADLRSTLFEAIEPIAGRLGVTVVRDGQRLETT